MYKVNKYLNDIIKELEMKISNIKLSSTTRTTYLKNKGKVDGIIMSIDVIKKYMSE